MPGLVGAAGDARTISFYHIHTKETLTVTYKRDGKYIPDALKQISHLLRDWRENDVTAIDPQTIDIAWEMHNELGSREPIHVISGYRSPKTNAMLRRTRGGQATKSQHMLGKAIDISFPDIPIRQLRYSAMIRERGGVGYYPTSAIPFVHVDTARVRAWPRMLRDELALLFPSGRSKHSPASGGPLTPDDSRRARQNNPGLATQVAQFFDLRSNPNKGIMVAAAPVPPAPQPAVRQASLNQVAAFVPPAPQPVTRTTQKSQERLQLASLAPSAPAPKLVTPPKIVDRPSRFTTGPTKTDRHSLDKLVTLASLDPAVSGGPQLVAAPQPVARKPAGLKPAYASLSALGGPVPSAEPAQLPPVTAAQPATTASQEPAQPPTGGSTLAAAAYLQGRFDNGISWIAAPAYDDDHPEDLSYQPFPMTAMLTDTASIDDPALVTLVHPDQRQTLSMLDDDGVVLPMRWRPGLQTAQLMWSQQFTGTAVSLTDLDAATRPAEAAQPAPIAQRSVKTSQR